ncbi:MAG TPA: ABC transporter permease subunit [Candidatus Dormibacteraeota bacterium]|nr:ABC transporter permease subunit [Candidatus Dormibacteraeota bacterium]
MIVSPASAAPPPRRYRATTSISLLGALVVWVALLGPLIALLVHLTPGAVVSALRQPGAWQPLEVSVLASLVALGVILLIGTPLAYLLARDRLPHPRVWEVGVILPLLTPPLVLGLLLVFMVGQATPIGAALSHLNLTASDTFFALVIAEIYEAVPYYVLGAEAAFAAVDPQLEQAAALLGDGHWRTWRRITLPLAAPGLAMTLAVTWARAMGAFGAVLIIAYHPFGLPMQIWTTLQESGLSAALPFALVLLVVALPLPIGAYVWSARARRRL